MKKKVIITADDYGVCNRIDNGIIQAVRKKIVTSVSVMVTHPHSRQRIEKLRELQVQMAAEGFDFGIGLHSSVTSGSPLHKTRDNGYPSSLADPKNPDYFRPEFSYPFSEIRPEDLEAELTKQFEFLASIIGKENIDHCTMHFGVAYFDKRLFPPYARVAGRFNVPVRSPMPWLKKFGGIAEIPDFDERLFNPTIRSGAPGMWRRAFSIISYGNKIKRMNSCAIRDVDYPDVIFDMVYGQCAKEIDKGKAVIDSALRVFSQNRLIEIKEANKKTHDKAKKIKMVHISERYKDYYAPKVFSFEFMFHLSKQSDPDPLLQNIPDTSQPHGVDTSYFPTREREFECLSNFDWTDYANQYDIEYIPFKKL